MRLVDGPVEGVYEVRQCPLYLRAVVPYEGNVARLDKRDVLDASFDRPRKGERIYVYRRRGEVGQIFFCGQAGGVYPTGTYAYMPEVDGEQLKDNAAWRRWCVIQAEGIEKGATR